MEAATNCYHWLICLSLVFNFPSAQVNTQNPQFSDPEFLASIVQAWKEYDQGLNERCPNLQIPQAGRKECYQQARKRLRGWLDQQAKICLKTSKLSESSMTSPDCFASADAVFSYIVRYRESLR
jgi:hypothetical protein